MKKFPALDFPVTSNTDRILAAIDDFRPTAVEEREAGLRVYFESVAARRAAHAALTDEGFAPLAVDVSDEDWARRSQEALGPVTIGRITVAPPWASQSAVDSQQSAVNHQSTTDPRLSTVDCRLPTLTIVIAPSMGFGTGHHATTRLCLAALQTIEMSNRSVLDIGTGSGVLALAAIRLGAARALGIDHDPDAIASATENLVLNALTTGGERAAFLGADLMSTPLPTSDIVTANLTGALLVRAADRLVSLVSPGGTLILSGLLAAEEPTVRAAFPSDVVWKAEEDGWVALVLSLHLQPSRLV